MILKVTVIVILAAQSCGGSPARSAAYAGDGNTQFGDTGKLKWNTSYSAQAAKDSDRKNCEWSVYTINDNHVMRVVGKGTYKNAKVKVEKPSTVKVYLKSLHCGLWKP